MLQFVHTWFAKQIANMMYKCVFVQVNTTLREVDIELGEQDWDEKKNINKRKKIILEGKNPDQVQMEKEKRIKKRKQAIKEKRKKMKKTEKKP